MSGKGVLMVYKKVIGIVGMPGCGKSVASNIGKELGFSVLVMGDVIREEVISRGLELTPENVSRIMLKIREKEGAAVVAKRCIKKIVDLRNDRIIIEGVRSLSEVEEYKRFFPFFKLLSIHSSPATRFSRIFNRRRRDDSQNRRDFNLRDRRELRVGIGSVIAMADYVIVNEGTLAEFKMKIRRFLEEH